MQHNARSERVCRSQTKYRISSLHDVNVRIQLLDESSTASLMGFNMNSRNGMNGRVVTLDGGFLGTEPSFIQYEFYQHLC